MLSFQAYGCQRHLPPAFPGAAAFRASPASRSFRGAQSGHATGSGLGARGAGQPQRGRAPRRHAPTRRTVKKEWQAAWLLRAITLHRPHDARRRRHAGQRARGSAPRRAQPVRGDLAGGARRRRSAPHRPARSASTTPSCRRRWRRWRARAFPWRRSRTGFPAGLTRFAQRVARDPRLGGGGRARRSTSSSRAPTCSPATGRRSTTRCAPSARPAATAHLKTILATGELATLRNVARASLVAMMAGADFIKTSTGQGEGQRHPARPPRDGARDPRLPRAHRLRGRLQAGRRHPHREEALDWLCLMKEELGDRWLRPTSSASAPAACSPTSSASSSTSSPGATRRRTAIPWREGHLIHDSSRRDLRDHGVRPRARERRRRRRRGWRRTAERFGHFIGGEWRKPADGESFETVNPATGKPLARVAQGGGRRRGRRRRGGARGLRRVARARRPRPRALPLRARAAGAEALAPARRARDRWTTASRSARRATSTSRWSPATSTTTPAGRS